jgi:hypothetical protein
LPDPTAPGNYVIALSASQLSNQATEIRGNPGRQIDLNPTDRIKSDFIIVATDPECVLSGI